MEHEIQFTAVSPYLYGKRVSIETFQRGKMGNYAKEMFRGISRLNLNKRLFHFIVLSLDEIGLTCPATYFEIKRMLRRNSLAPLSLEASLFLASTHWNWRKPEGADIKFFMNPVETLYGYMGYMIKDPGYMLDGYEIGNTWFYPHEVFVFSYVKPEWN